LESTIAIKPPDEKVVAWAVIGKKADSVAQAQITAQRIG